MKDFCRSCSAVLSRRGRFFAVLNVLFFVVLLAIALVSSSLFAPPPAEGELVDVFLGLFDGDWLFMVLGIFVFNLVLSAFAVVTLPGLVFFLLSPVLLLYRAVVWGCLLAFSSSGRFLAALPIVVLEGEAYVLAAVAGTVLGLGWLKPDWVYGGEGLSRREALRRAFKEALRLYVLVALILFVAAAIETAAVLWH